MEVQYLGEVLVKAELHSAVPRLSLSPRLKLVRKQYIFELCSEDSTSIKLALPQSGKTMLRVL